MMRANAVGLLTNAAAELEDDNGESVAGYAFALRELADNLQELAKAGDLETLKRFCELYSLPFGE